MTKRWISILMVLNAACTDANFGGQSVSSGANRGKKTPHDSDANKNGDESQNIDQSNIFSNSPLPTDPKLDEVPGIGTLPGDTAISTDGGQVKVRPCSAPLNVPGSANPWFAGVQASTVYKYPRAKHCSDSHGQDAPPQVTFDQTYCLKDGARLYFNISGQIDHGGERSGADGGTMTWLDAGQRFGKSNLQAPINSMLGVFLDDSDPSAESEPAGLAYGSSDTREQLEQKPLLRQVFFIGDGKTSGGQFQRVVVPKGAKRFFFAVMDSFEWCNNSGILTGNVMWEPAP